MRQNGDTSDAGYRQQSEMGGYQWQALMDIRGRPPCQPGIWNWKLGLLTSLRRKSPEMTSAEKALVRDRIWIRTLKNGLDFSRKLWGEEEDISGGEMSMDKGTKDGRSWELLSPSSVAMPTVLTNPIKEKAETDPTWNGLVMRKPRAIDSLYSSLCVGGSYLPIAFGTWIFAMPVPVGWLSVSSKQQWGQSVSGIGCPQWPTVKCCISWLWLSCYWAHFCLDVALWSTLGDVKLHNRALGPKHSHTNKWKQTRHWGVPPEVWQPTSLKVTNPIVYHPP